MIDILRAASLAMFTFRKQNRFRTFHIEKTTHLLSPIKYLPYNLLETKPRQSHPSVGPDQSGTVSLPYNIVLTPITSLSFLEDVFHFFILTDRFGDIISQFSIISISGITPKFTSSNPLSSTIIGRDEGPRTFAWIGNPETVFFFLPLLVLFLLWTFALSICL